TGAWAGDAKTGESPYVATQMVFMVRAIAKDVLTESQAADLVHKRGLAFQMDVNTVLALQHDTALQVSEQELRQIEKIVHEAKLVTKLPSIEAVPNIASEVGDPSALGKDLHKVGL